MRIDKRDGSLRLGAVVNFAPCVMEKDQFELRDSLSATNDGSSPSGFLEVRNFARRSAAW
jgi:hypothetical protein